MKYLQALTLIYFKSSFSGYFEGKIIIFAIQK